MRNKEAIVMLKKGGKRLGYQVNLMERMGDEKNVEEWENEQTQHFKYICRIALLRDSRNEGG